MNRKRIFGITVSVIVLIGIVFFVYFKDRNLDLTYEQDQKRIENIEKIISEEDLDNPPEKEIPDGLYSGTTIFFKNKSDFLKKIEDFDTGILVANNIIPNLINYTNIMVEDTNESNIEKYYDANKQTIDYILGTSNVEEYREIFNEIKIIGKVEEISIDINSVEDLGNGARFDLFLVGTLGEGRINVKSVVSDYKEGIVYYYLEV